MTLLAYSAIVKMQRKAREDLAVHKIKVRLSMNRWEMSNDCFCGKRELLLLSGTVLFNDCLLFIV